MLELPKVSVSQIQRLVGDRSLEKGRAYAADEAVFDTRVQGTTLKARCQGSQGGPYRISVSLDGSGIARASCSCPVGGGGQCKHVAAVLLTWRKDPDAFEPAEALDAALARRTKEELVAVIKQMLREQPDLEPLLTTPLPVPGAAASVKATPGAFRKQAANVFKRAGDEWGAESQIADGLSGICEIGEGFFRQGDYAGAAAVYQGVAEAVREEAYADENGDLLGILDTCAGELRKCFAAVKDDAAARRDVLAALFELYRFGIGDGRDVADAADAALLEDTTPDEKRQVAGWVRQAMRKADGWERDAYGGMLLDLEKDTLDDEAFLRVCRESGRTDDLIDRLLKLGRVDEAARELEQAAAGREFDLPRLADLFVSYRHADVAKGVVLRRLREGRGKAEGQAYDASYRQVALLEWLRKRAAARHDAAEELSLGARVFHLQPSLAGYNDLKKKAGKLGKWDALRGELLARLRPAGYSDLLIQIHLADGELDEAVALVKKPDRYGYGRAMDLAVAKAAEKARPRVSLEIYTRRAESLIKEFGGRPSYREACGFLKKVKALYAGLGEPESWDKYVARVREQNVKRRALKEEMARARL